MPGFFWIAVMIGAFGVANMGTAKIAYGADIQVLIGMHTSGTASGIRVAQFNTQTGALSTPTLAAQGDATAFMAVTADARHVYATNSVANFGGLAHMGAISAYARDAGGKLTLLNQLPSGGENPPYVALDKTERFVLVANYNGNAVPGEGGSVAVFSLKADGLLGERTGFDQHKGTSVDPVRQTQAYAHSIIVDPTNKFVLSADLGLDKIFVYRFDAATGKIAANDPPFATVTAGAGPRHLAFHPNGAILYATEEMASKVAVFQWNADKGVLTRTQEISTLPADFSGTSTAAEVRVSANGKWLYASNRGHDSIAQFAIDPATFRLTMVRTVPSGGTVPRNFDISPDGKWMVVANHGDETVVVFAIGAEDGKLKQTGGALKVTSPFGVRFVPMP